MRLISTKKLTGGIALAGALTVGVISGFAQQAPAPDQNQANRPPFGHRGGRHHGGMRGLGFFARNLNLTDAQKTQIEQITANYRQNAKNLHEQQRALRQDKSGLADGTFNEAAVRQAAQARANLQVELDVARARMMSEVHAVLTPEQKAQLAAERQQREQKRQERRAQRQQNANPAR